jgi:polar amino acid transport system substrate-binding protein
MKLFSPLASRKPLVVTSTLAGITLLLTGCASGTEATDATSDAPAQGDSSTEEIGTDSIAGTFDQSIADLLPAEIAEAGTILSGGGPGYAPFYLLADDGETLVGADPELLRAAGDVLGVEIEFSALGFDALIPALQSNRIDMAAGAFSITPERLEVVDFVSYFAGGTSLIVPAGNPKDIDLESMCGTTIAVQQGTVYADNYMPIFNDECVAAGEEEITISIFPTQPDATIALGAGRADASMSDYGPLVYVAERSNDQFEVLQENYDPSTWGFGFPQGSELSPAIAAAFTALMEDGTYTEILEKWGVADGAVTESEVVTSAG